MVPSYPGESEKPNDEVAAGTTGSSVEERRKLFAHFLWSAAMVVAEGIEDADAHDALGDVDGDKRMWKVKGKSVLELGAGVFLFILCLKCIYANNVGAALPSLIAALAHASTVTITDHPFSPAFTSAIPFNITNIPPNNQCKIDIHPHEWGTLSTDPWTTAHKNTYTRIIAADCFWMRSQHANLVRTMRWFLAPGGRVWVVAGFHTGRAVVEGFFEEAVAGGFTVENIYERDLNAEGVNGGEVRRRWMVEREGVENRKRWCVVAVLARTGTEPDT